MIVVHTLLILGVVYLFFKREGSQQPMLFWSTFTFRVAMGIALGLMYSYYYEANDTWGFFLDATKLANLARINLSEYINFMLTSDPVQPVWQSLNFTQERSLFLVKIISVLALAGDDNYWVCTLYFATISFCSAWIFFRVVTKHFSDATASAAISILLLPSVVFWSSGLVKETLALAGIFWMSAVFIKLIKKDSIPWWHWLIVLIALAAAWNLKYYWTAVFMAVAITTLLTRWIQMIWSRIQSFWLPVWFLLFILICIGASQLHPNFYLSRFLEVLTDNHNEFVRISKPENLIRFYNVHPSWWCVGINSPWALLSGLFRPLPGEIQSLAGLVAGMENMLLIVLLMGAFFKKQSVEDKLLLTAVVVYIALLCILLAISTPNMGTLSRYRIGFLPFFVFLISYRNPLLNYFVVKVPFLNR